MYHWHHPFNIEYQQNIAVFKDTNISCRVLKLYLFVRINNKVQVVWKIQIILRCCFFLRMVGDMVPPPKKQKQTNRTNKKQQQQIDPKQKLNSAT